MYGSLDTTSVIKLMYYMLQGGAGLWILYIRWEGGFGQQATKKIFDTDAQLAWETNWHM